MVYHHFPQLLVICYIAMEDMAIEIVDLFSLKIVIFHSYVEVPEDRFTILNS